MGVYRKYFLEGELPEEGKVCGVDRGYFPVEGGEQGVRVGLVTAEQEMSELETEEARLRRIGEGLAAKWGEWLGVA